MDVEIRREVRRAFDDIVTGAGEPADAEQLTPIYPLGPDAPRRSVGVLASMLVALAIVAGVVAIAPDRTTSEDLGAVAADGDDSIAAQVQASSQELGVTTGDPCGLHDSSLLRKWWSQELEPPPFIPVVRYSDEGECTVGGWVGREHVLPGFEVYASGGTGELGEQPIRTRADIYNEQGRAIGELRVDGPVYEE